MSHAVFVYGSLMTGEPNHARLRGARLVAAARTEPQYTLVNLGAFPAMLDGGATSVVGEVFEVDDVTLRALDRFEGTPTFYRRARVPLLGGQSAQGYLLARPAAPHHEPIPSGDWREHQCGSKS